LSLGLLIISGRKDAFSIKQAVLLVLLVVVVVVASSLYIYMGGNNNMRMKAFETVFLRLLTLLCGFYH
jgi:heme/copper-type cytochrome/quinol oxidase subunit 4